MPYPFPNPNKLHLPPSPPPLPLSAYQSGQAASALSSAYAQAASASVAGPPDMSSLSSVPAANPFQPTTEQISAMYQNHYSGLAEIYDFSSIYGAGGFSGYNSMAGLTGMTNMYQNISAVPTQTVPEFLFQLIKMLTDDNKEIIEWVDGKIAVHQPTKLATSVLHRYFRHSKYASFQRQLNYFGFRKIAGKGKVRRRQERKRPTNGAKA